jgi:uncharacterized protein (DUF111 family)
MVRTEHGMVPLPRPEVMEMLHGVPTYSRGIPVELVTATGAAILASVSEGYGDIPMMRADHVGYGAGHLRLDFPNVLRVVIGEEERAATPTTGTAGFDGFTEVLVAASVPGSGSDGATMLIERILASGAREAWLTPTIGAGGEPGTILSAVAPVGRRDDVVRALRTEPGIGQVRITPVSVPPEA